jgi:hypothetical protein
VFGDGAKSSEVAALIRETETASLSAGEAAERARMRALDPALSANGVADARRQMDDAEFRRERLQTEVTRLRERLKEVKEEEEDQRRQLCYDRLKAERDKLAAELVDIYPGFAQKLADLLPRIAANDREVEYINAHALPRGSKVLDVAELVARGLGGFVERGVHIPRITQMLRLPAFKYSEYEPYVWPRSR